MITSCKAKIFWKKSKSAQSKQTKEVAAKG